MRIFLHSKFKKHYQQRIIPFPKLDIKYRQRVSIFIQNPLHPILKDHQLIGSRYHHRAFWITGDIRVIYQKTETDVVVFLDIGTHNQVY